jgi:hypothetical protein
MQFRKLRLFSWKSGYDVKDCRNRKYRKIVARRIRKQEKLLLQKEIE